MKRFKVIGIAFFGLCLLATLFPPFIWGEELFQEQDASLTYKLELSQSGGLPLKKYAFLFGDSKQKLYSGLWFWNEQEKESKPLYVSAQRRLLVSELLLEYVLAFIIAFISAFMIPLLRWGPFTVSKARRKSAD
jgi:hypothetical protein